MEVNKTFEKLSLFSQQGDFENFLGLGEKYWHNSSLFSQVEMWFPEASTGFLDVMNVNKEGLVISR